jgi:hypothetical protein
MIICLFRRLFVVLYHHAAKIVDAVNNSSSMIGTFEYIQFM